MLQWFPQLPEFAQRVPQPVDLGPELALQAPRGVVGEAAQSPQAPGAYPDFSFPQDQNPELARPGWSPRFVDYLYVSFTNACA